MKILTLHGLAWHAQSPSRFLLLGYPGTCLLAYCGPRNGWQLLSSSGSPIGCPDRDTGAAWIARAIQDVRAGTGGAP